jgi:hypothetical protein
MPTAPRPAALPLVPRRVPPESQQEFVDEPSAPLSVSSNSMVPGRHDAGDVAADHWRYTGDVLDGPDRLQRMGPVDAWTAGNQGQPPRHRHARRGAASILRRAGTEGCGTAHNEETPEASGATIERGHSPLATGAHPRTERVDGVMIPFPRCQPAGILSRGGSPNTMDRHSRQTGTLLSVHLDRERRSV